MSKPSHLKVTVLGSGTSQGMPVIACNCEVCASTNPMDNRLRSSILLTIDEKNYVIDTGPDFRQQMLRKNVQSMEAVIFTHEHKDHVAGLDDIRAFNFKQNCDMDVFCTSEVEVALKREFSYIFNDNPYPGIPKVNIRNITKKPFFIGNIEFIPIEVMHYKMPVLGFRVGNFTYITDARTITNTEKEKVKGTKILIVNALRISEHISHFNLEQALEFIAEIKPQKAYLTHISHLLGKHADIQKILPENVFLAYDGLHFETEF